MLTLLLRTVRVGDVWQRLDATIGSRGKHAEGNWNAVTGGAEVLDGVCSKLVTRGCKVRNAIGSSGDHGGLLVTGHFDPFRQFDLIL